MIAFTLYRRKRGGAETTETMNKGRNVGGVNDLRRVAAHAHQEL
jgi:hypothetical protein